MTVGVSKVEARDFAWRAASVWSMGLVGLYVALITTLGSPVTISLAYNAAGIGAATAAFIAARRTRSPIFWWLAIGITLWTIGDISWDAWDLRYGPPPYPSVIEVLYFAYYPFVIVGLLHIRRQMSFVGRTRWARSVGLIAVGWLVLGGWVFFDTQGSAAARLAALGLVVGDTIVLLLFAYEGLRRPRPIPMWLVYLGLSLVFNAIGDMLYGYSSTTGGYDAGGLADLTIVIASVLLTCSALHPSIGELVVHDS